MKDKLNRILKSPFVTLKKDLFCNTHHFNQCKELQLLFKRFWIIWYFLYNFSSFNTELRSFFFFYPFFIFLIDSMFFFCSFWLWITNQNQSYLFTSIKINKALVVIFFQYYRLTLFLLKSNHILSIVSRFNLKENTLQKLLWKSNRPPFRLQPSNITIRKCGFSL